MYRFDFLEVPYTTRKGLSSKVKLVMSMFGKKVEFEKYLHDTCADFDSLEKQLKYYVVSFWEKNFKSLLKEYIVNVWEVRKQRRSLFPRPFCGHLSCRSGADKLWGYI